jgi:hypothetical protein
MMVNTLETNKKGEDVKLGVDLGVIEPEAPEVATIEGVAFGVVPVGNEKVEVRFSEDADVDSEAAENTDSYVITEKEDADKVLEVVSVYYDADDKVAIVETESQKNGKAYTMNIGGMTDNFAGLKAITAKPVVDDVDGTDTNVVEVTFEKNIDKETAENIDNYYIPGVEIVDAKVDADDKRIVKIYTDGMDKKQTRKLTLENIESADGVVMSKSTKTFVSDVDKDAPEVEDIIVENNIRLTVVFDDEHGIDKASAEDIANYDIDGLDIIKIEAQRGANNDDDPSEDFDRVEITTEEQTKSKYTIEINGVVDGSYAANVMTKAEKESFRSKDEDDDKPELDKADAKNGNEIWVYFDEDNYLDPASALDTDNYEIKNDDLDIYEARFKNDDEESKVIILTTSTQDDEENYKLYVENVEDEFGNVMDRDDDGFDGSDVDVQKPYIKSIKYYFDDDAKSSDKDNGEVKDDDDDKYKVMLIFNEELTKESAEDPTNYEIDGLGRAIEADYHDEDEDNKAFDNKSVVVLTIQEPKANDEYVIKVEGIEDLFGNTMMNDSVEFTATENDKDITKPEVDDIEAISKREIRVTFSEDINIKASALTVTDQDTNTAVVVEFMALLDSDSSVAVYRTASVELDNDHEYLGKFDTTKVTDDAGNSLDIDEAQEEFDGSDDDVDDTDTFLDLSSGDWDQENIKKFIFEFDEEFLFTADTKAVAAGSLNGDYTVTKGAIKLKGSAVDYKLGEWTVEYGDDNTILELHAKNEVPDETELVIDFTKIITNMIGYNDETNGIDKDLAEFEIEASEEDDEEPVLEEVVTIDKRTIHVVYDEDLSGTGSYKVTNDDDDDKEIDIASKEIDDNKVILRLEDDLESGDTYTLTVSKGAKDLAGNREDADDDEYSFDGTDKDVESTIYVTGVEIISSKKVIVNFSDDVHGDATTAGNAKFTVKQGTNDVAFDFAAGGEVISDGTATIAYASTEDDDITMYFDEPLVDGKTYKVTVTDEFGGEAITLTYEFEGNVEDGDLVVELVEGSGNEKKAELSFGDYDEDDGFDIEVSFTASGSSAAKLYSVGTVTAGSVSAGAVDGTDLAIKATADNDLDLTVSGANLAIGDEFVVEVLDGTTVIYTLTHVVK